MTVQLRTFMPGWNVGQPVRGFDSEDFEDVHERALQIAARAVLCVRTWAGNGGYGCNQIARVSY